MFTIIYVLRFYVRPTIVKKESRKNKGPTTTTKKVRMKKPPFGLNTR